jgi:hypothetical protein
MDKSAREGRDISMIRTTGQWEVVMKVLLFLRDTPVSQRHSNIREDVRMVPGRYLGC